MHKLLHKSSSSFFYPKDRIADFHNTQSKRNPNLSSKYSIPFYFSTDIFWPVEKCPNIPYSLCRLFVPNLYIYHSFSIQVLYQEYYKKSTKKVIEVKKDCWWNQQTFFAEILTNRSLFPREDHPILANNIGVIVVWNKRRCPSHKHTASNHFRNCLVFIDFLLSF